MTAVELLFLILQDLVVATTHMMITFVVNVEKVFLIIGMMIMCMK